MKSALLVETMDVELHAPFTKSPLDAFRGAGRRKPIPRAAVDISGNVVPLAPEKKKPGRKKKVLDHTVKISTDPVILYFK